MSVCDLTTGLTMLQRSMKKFRDVWTVSQDEWRDKTAKDFHDEHLQPLVTQLTMTAAAVHRLADAVKQAEKACGDHDRDR